MIGVTGMAEAALERFEPLVEKSTNPSDERISEILSIIGSLPNELKERALEKIMDIPVSAFTKEHLEKMVKMLGSDDSKTRFVITLAFDNLIKRAESLRQLRRLEDALDESSAKWELNPVQKTVVSLLKSSLEDEKKSLKAVIFLPEAEFGKTIASIRATSRLRIISRKQYLPVCGLAFRHARSG